MSESPQPGGNWDEQNKNNRKKYARILTIGLIVSAVSIAAVRLILMLNISVVENIFLGVFY